MKVLKEVDTFMKTLNNTNRNNLVSLINHDVDKCDRELKESYLMHRYPLSHPWSEYTLSDIDFIYEEDIISACTRLESYGFLDFINQLGLDDDVLFCIYQFDLYDYFGGVMDRALLIHVTIGKPESMHENYWFLITNA